MLNIYKDETNLLFDFILFDKEQIMFLSSEFYLLFNICQDLVSFVWLSNSSEKSKREMQKIILFVEPIHETCYTPAKMGNLFVNRFAIDENASCEILKRFELGKTSLEMSLS